MGNYYYTYSNDGKQPFTGGWTVVNAKDNIAANRLFESVHHNTKDDLLDCAGVYTEKEFAGTVMCDKSNFGKREQEYITAYISTKDTEKDIKQLADILSKFINDHAEPKNKSDLTLISIMHDMETLQSNLVKAGYAKDITKSYTVTMVLEAESWVTTDNKEEVFDIIKKNAEKYPEIKDYTITKVDPEKNSETEYIVSTDIVIKYTVKAYSEGQAIAKTVSHAESKLDDFVICQSKEMISIEKE